MSTTAEIGSSPPSSTITGTTKTTTASSSAVSSSSTFEPHDRLSRTWRSLLQYVIAATNKAERAVTIQLSGTSSSGEDAAMATKNALREVDKLILEFLRNRIEWSRLISTLEAKLEGKAEEMENMQQYVRCQPALGMRKRRRTSSIPTGELEHTDSPSLITTTTAPTPGDGSHMTPHGIDAATTMTSSSVSNLSVSPLIATVAAPSVEKEMQNHDQ